MQGQQTNNSNSDSSRLFYLVVIIALGVIILDLAPLSSLQAGIAGKVDDWQYTPKQGEPLADLTEFAGNYISSFVAVNFFQVSPQAAVTVVRKASSLLREHYLRAVLSCAPLESHRAPHRCLAGQPRVKWALQLAELRISITLETILRKTTYQYQQTFLTKGYSMITTLTRGSNSNVRNCFVPPTAEL